MRLLLLLGVACQGQVDPDYACFDATCWKTDSSLQVPETFPEAPDDLAKNPTAFKLDSGVTVAIARDLLLLEVTSDDAWRQLEKKYDLEEVEDTWGLLRHRYQISTDGSTKELPSKQHLVRMGENIAYPASLAMWMAKLGQSGSVTFLDDSARDIFSLQGQMLYEDDRKVVASPVILGIDGQTIPSSERVSSDYDVSAEDAESCECYVDDAGAMCSPESTGCTFDGRKDLPDDHHCNFRDSVAPRYDTLVFEEVALYQARTGNSPFYVDDWYDQIETLVDNCDHSGVSGAIYELFSDKCDGPVVGAHMWFIPETSLPFTLDTLVWDDSIPPGAVDSPPQGTHRAPDNTSRCEWIEASEAVVSTSPDNWTRKYRNVSAWDWTEHTSDERIFVLAFDGDDCKDYTDFLADWFGWDSATRWLCNPDDPLAWFWLTRSETIDDDASTEGVVDGIPDGGTSVTLDDAGESDFPGISESHDDMRVTLRTIVECQTGDLESACDGHDENCNGVVDEGLRNSCGDCGDTLEEVCNGLDDDCNGLVDDSPVDLPLDAIEGCCDNPCMATEEICDGIDNDCDCVTDEEFPQQGDACGSTIGACDSGAFVCTSGELACDGGTTATEELCGDDLDNDCDGSTDEGFFCCDGDTRSCGLTSGNCEQGTQTCADNAWSACVGAVLPAAETCDGTDENCDGAVDDDAGCVCDPATDADRTCGLATGSCIEGTQSCEGDYWGACEGADYAHYWDGYENCNAADDDCDGVADEDVAAISCSTTCGSGTQECVGGAWQACDAVMPEDEVCNGYDDDCDGDVDSPIALELCPLQDGVCAGSTRMCGGTSGWLSCDTDNYGYYYEEYEETCDGFDNDCDGTSDENMVGYRNPEHCGACNQECNDINGLSACVDDTTAANGESCEMSCDAGYLDLNEEGVDGCEVTCQADELAMIGVADGDSKVHVNSASFDLCGNGTATGTLTKPDGDAFFLIGFVEYEDSGGEDDLGWWLDWTEDASSYEVSVRRQWGDGGHCIGGRFLLFGFDTDAFGIVEDITDDVCVEGNDNDSFTIAPEDWGEDFTKHIGLPFWYAYDTSTDDDFCTQISSYEDGSCNSYYSSRAWDGNGGSDLRYYGCQVAFPSDIRIEREEFSVYNGDTEEVSFTVDASSDVIWLPLVTTYDANTDDEFGWSATCEYSSATEVTCDVSAFDGSSSSFINVEIILLENPDSF